VERSFPLFDIVVADKTGGGDSWSGSVYGFSAEQYKEGCWKLAALLWKVGCLQVGGDYRGILYQKRLLSSIFAWMYGYVLMT
jgi:hypothetical protein